MSKRIYLLLSKGVEDRLNNLMKVEGYLTRAEALRIVIKKGLDVLEAGN